VPPFTLDPHEKANAERQPQALKEVEEDRVGHLALAAIIANGGAGATARACQDRTS
jgi:hypothetical protein